VIHHEPVSEQRPVRPEHLLPESRHLVPEKRERGVVGDRAQVTTVVRDALALEQQRANPVRPLRYGATGHRFIRHAVAEGMGDRGVSGDPAGQPVPLLPRQGLETFLDSLVDVPEAFLEVHDILADGLEAKVARLDDPRVHRPDRYLVDPLTAYFPEGKRTRSRIGSCVPCEILSQGETIHRPIFMEKVGARIGMTLRGQPEERHDFSLIGGGLMDRGGE